MIKRKILVVDDEAEVRDIIKISLENEGFTVLEAADGTAALTLAQKEKPDLITLDIMMPGIDGLQVAKLLKEDAKTAHIPIIIISAVLTPDKRRCIQGIADFISKPFEPSSLVVKIYELIKNKELSEPPKNILVVDDDPEIIDIISLALREQAFHVESACDGVEALEKLKTFTPNLIILDIKMPRMDGFEFIRCLKQNEQFSSIPIIALTGTHISEENIENGLVLGTAQYMKKLFSIENLIKEITSLTSPQQSDA